MAKISVALYYKAKLGRSEEVRMQIIALKEEASNIVSAAEVSDSYGFTGFVRIDAESAEEYDKIKSKIVRLHGIVETNEIVFTNRFIELSKRALI